MRCLIRFLTRGAAGAIETRERTFDGDVLTLGRATDQILQLKDRRVALEHARIARRAGHTVLTAEGQASVVVNGSLAREARLAPGDTVQVGANLLHVIAPPAGFDLAFTFELDPAARAEEADSPAAQLRVGDSLFGMRSWSWLLFLLVLLLGLAIPASGLLDDAWQARLRSTVLPADTSWTAGPLAGVHHVVAEKCEACHERPFVRVRDEACLACHGPQLRGHAAAAEHGATPDRSRCTDCHREHDGSVMLVRTDDATCASCHADIRPIAGAAGDSGNAADFGDAHPEFRVTMLRITKAPTAAGAVKWQHDTRRVRPGATDGTEDSGLVFEHDTHLDPKGIRSPFGAAVLDCADCHRPEPGGARLQPVSMERDCAGCHRLDFDPAEPDRFVPHGDPAIVLETLVEYYSKRYLQGFPDALASARPPRPLARPGPALSTADRAAALEKARLRAMDAARDLFERRSCVTCHEIERVEPGNAAAGWTVRPVMLTQSWMPEARFDHARHGTGLTPCATCHAATTSKDARDILMPPIHVCRDCHAGSAVSTSDANTVASGCMTCHDFHRDTQPLWRDAGRMRAVAKAGTQP